MENIGEIIKKYKANPFEVYPVLTPHTGYVHLMVKLGQTVKRPIKPWQQKGGTLLYTILRQGNLKRIYAPIDGEIMDIKRELDEQFVEANTYLMSIRHPLTEDEIIDKILSDFLDIFRAPEAAKYYFVPELAKKIEERGLQRVIIQPGEEILIMSRMKRDIHLVYEGRPGIIHTVYFKPNVTIPEGEPLLGICPPERVSFINDLVQRIRLEWKV